MEYYKIDFLFQFASELHLHSSELAVFSEVEVEVDGKYLAEPELSSNIAGQ